MLAIARTLFIFLLSLQYFCYNIVGFAYLSIVDIETTYIVAQFNNHFEITLTESNL